MLGQCPFNQYWDISLCVAECLEPVRDVQITHEAGDGISQHLVGVLGPDMRHVRTNRSGGFKMTLRIGRRGKE